MRPGDPLREELLFRGISRAFSFMVPRLFTVGHFESSIDAESLTAYPAGGRRFGTHSICSVFTTSAFSSQPASY